MSMGTGPILLKSEKKGPRPNGGTAIFLNPGSCDGSVVSGQFLETPKFLSIPRPPPQPPASRSHQCTPTGAALREDPALSPCSTQPGPAPLQAQSSPQRPRSHAPAPTPHLHLRHPGLWNPLTSPDAPQVDVPSPPDQAANVQVPSRRCGPGWGGLYTPQCRPQLNAWGLSLCVLPKAALHSPKILNCN